MSVSERTLLEMERGRIIAQRKQRESDLSRLVEGKKVKIMVAMPGHAYWEDRGRVNLFYVDDVQIGHQNEMDDDYPSELIMATIQLAVSATVGYEGGAERYDDRPRHTSPPRRIPVADGAEPEDHGAGTTLMRKGLREMERYDASLVAQALRVEHENRMNAFRNLQAQGHVTIMMDEQPDVIRVRIDEEYFTDSRADFPTSHLIARLQLAVHAGQSDRKRILDTGKTPRDIYRDFAETYQQDPRTIKGVRDFVWEDELYDYKVGGDYLHPPITATVKPPKFKKGLRP